MCDNRENRSAQGNDNPNETRFQPETIYKYIDNAGILVQCLLCKILPMRPSRFNEHAKRFHVCRAPLENGGYMCTFCNFFDLDETKILIHLKSHVKQDCLKKDHVIKSFLK